MTTLALTLLVLGCGFAVAQLLADGRGRSRSWARALASGELREAVTRSLVVLAILPLVGLTLLLSEQQLAAARARKSAEVDEAAASAASLIDGFMQKHQAGVRSAAESIGLDGPPDTHRIETLLLKFHRLYPDFLSMTVTDATGHVSGTTVARRGAEPVLLEQSGTSVADRDYFQQPMRTGQSYLSGAFLGRGIGHDPIIAISTAIQIDGESWGIVEGSLNLRAFGRLDERYRRLFGGHLVLIDDAGRIIYAHPETGFDLLEDVGKAKWLAHARPDGTWTFPMKDGEGDWLAGMQETPVGWRAVVLVPKPLLATELQAIYPLALKWLLLMLALAAAIAGALALRIRRPMTRLLRELTQNDHRDRGARFRRLDGLPLEFVRAFRELHRFELRQDHALHCAESASRAKAAFLATTSHELRTPLNAIIGFSTLLLTEQHGPILEEQRKPLEIIKRSGELQLRIVRDVLDFAAIEAGTLRVDREPIELAPVLTEVRDSLVLMARERGVTLPAIECDSSLRVMADGVRLGQAVRNLVANGLAYTDLGHVKVRAFNAGEFAQIDVVDSGIGIPADQLAKVFQAFEPILRPANRHRHGTGLGLAITRNLVEAMGGEVGVDSAIQAGSKFWIRIPLAA